MGEELLHCKYCDKECKNRNSLIQHEIRCKKNPDKILVDFSKRRSRKGINIGRKWVNNGFENKFIPLEFVDEYLKSGWLLGIKNSSKIKISESLKGKSFGRCKDPIKEEERKRKISNSMKGNTNWMYNKRRGNGKKGWYKGIFCDSTWELAYVVYHTEHDMFIKRCDIKFSYEWEGVTRTYFPDFITNEGIIEIKGKFDKKSIYKRKCFPDIKIINLDLIKPYLKYVIDKYGEEFWNILYKKKEK